MKRALDLILIAVFSVPLALLTLGVGIAVALSIGRPVLFRQVRPGRNAAPFEMIKFRTMTDARDDDGAPLPDDLRLTRFGRFMRATSLDELPEIWNVMRGEMSVVGPRPLLMQYVPLYDATEMRRHEVLPGITGWAQVNGRNSLTWDAKFALDVWYVDHGSLWLDLRILILTVAKVIRRDGIAADGSATMPIFTGCPRK